MNVKIIDVKGTMMLKKITWIMKRVARSYALSLLLFGQSVSCARVEQKVSGSGSWTEVVAGSSLSFDSVAVGLNNKMLALDPRGQVYRFQDDRWILTSCPPAIWVAVGNDGSEFLIDGKNDLYRIIKAGSGSGDTVTRVDGAPKMSTLVVADAKNMWSSFKNKLSQCENGAWKETSIDGSLVILKGTKAIAINSASGQVALFERKKPVAPPVVVKPAPEVPKAPAAEPEKPAPVVPVAPVVEIKKEEPKVVAPTKKAKKPVKKSRKKVSKKAAKKSTKKSTKKSAKKKPVARKSSVRKTPVSRGSKSSAVKGASAKKSVTKRPVSKRPAKKVIKTDDESEK